MVVPVDQRTIASLLARVEPFGELDEGTRLDVAGRAAGWLARPDRLLAR
jgi:hypothetical protein